MNCACTYEMALAGPDCLPPDWKFKGPLKGDHVQSGFMILSLLEDHHECTTTLIVPHTGEQADCFMEAIKARNARIKLYGQKEVAISAKSVHVSMLLKMVTMSTLVVMLPMEVNIWLLAQLLCLCGSL